MKISGYDFSGWATRPNLLCSDGRVILKDAFKDCDGKKVPLVWNHVHDNSSEVLGHAVLESKDGGIYAYCFFNNTDGGRNGKELVRHGDVTSLSIFANQLKENGKNVLHGMIREVSLVLAAANPGATIDMILEHSDDFDGEAIIDVGYENANLLMHSAKDDDDEEEDEEEEVIEDEDEEEEDDEEEEEEPKPSKASKMPKKTKKITTTRSSAEEDEEDEKPDEDDEDDEDELKHADEGGEKSVQDVFNTLSDEQKAAVAVIVGQILADTDKGANEGSEDGEAEAAEKSDNKDEVKHSDNSFEGDNTNMKYNIFEGAEGESRPVISHADQQAVIELAKKCGSLKHAVEMSIEEGGVLAHAITDHNGNSVTYGIANIDYLFPDVRSLNNPPELINKPEEWVDKVINGTHHTPFSRVKSMFADLSGEDARARGYVKGKKKVEEVIETLKRETYPQTIYKKQKLDRDDIIDITDFDVVAWLKAEMQIMLKAEIARAILIGDGRQAGDDKIKEANVRPIYNDDDLFTVKVPVNVAANATDAVKASAIIDAVILSRKDYKGSGNPSFFINEDYLGQMLILKDGMGRRIYETEASLAAALRVKELIPVDVMDGQKIAITEGQSTSNKDLVGVIVNLQDYNVGADKGGATSFFDDFDIDYNQFKYLYETRMSGALIKPYSAMSIYMNEA